MLMGSGCSQRSTPTQATRDTPPESSLSPTATSTPSTQQKAPANDKKPQPSKSLTELEDLPAFTPPTQPLEDDRAWKMLTTKTGVTLTYPATGPNAMKISYARLAENDPHLQEGCYVTRTTKYKNPHIPGYTQSCQTTTAFNTASGVRTDYFVFQTSYQENDDKLVTINHLFTFTKAYSKGFDMNLYGAILNKVIAIID